MPAPRSTLRSSAALIAAGVSVYWVFSGAHRGWSMNKVPIARIDEITEIEYTDYEDRFVPGIEVLGAGWTLAALLVGASCLIKPRP